MLFRSQAYLPARQEPQGVEAESGVDIYDKGFMPEGVRIQGGDKYPYPTPDSSSKGLDALRYAYRLANTRQGQSPLGRKNGGPLYLQEGNDGTTVGSEDQSYIEKLNRELAAEQEQERRKIEEETSKPFVDPRISKYIKRAEEEKNKYAYSRPESFQESTSPFESVSPGQRLSQEYGKRFREAMSVPQTDIFTRMINPPEGGYRLFGNSDEEQSLISQTEDSTPPGWTTPPEKQSGSPRPDQTGIASVPPRPSILDQARGITQGAYPIDSYTGQDQGKAGIPSARPALAPPQIAPRDSSGKTIGTPPAGPIVTPPAGPTAEDTSFNSVMSQVQKAIGSKVPDELQDQMKDYQKNLAQMGNDKVVDALFAAAKTLGGQRMGQRNFADAIANAGLAAQEAQKRIYKAEDDMRKYRGDLLKAQDTNNREAATIAMNRIVQLDHDRKGLQIAMIQAQKANDTATMQMDRYEKIAQYKDVSERRRAIINRLGQIQRAKADITPSQYDVDPRETEKKLAPYNREEAGLQAELDELNRQSPGSKIIKPSNIQSKPTREDLKSKYGLD